QPRLVNMYGITETTVHVTHRLLSLADAQGEHRSVIGVPIADLSLAVVDRSLSPVPLGVPGELVVGGAGLARGYLGRPELTAERFIPDPAGGWPGARLYRSGDLGRFLPNGVVEYLGRLDHQVKIRGFRIEPGEIEAALVALAGVQQAVVLVREDRLGDRRLVAYIVGDVSVAELRRSLRAQLLDYMVPAAFVTLAAMPLTVNGKVDRKALPAPEQPGDEESHLAPRTPVEEVLAGIWTELLGVDRIGTAGHFFDLGGHSLVAMRVISRLRSVFGVELPLRVLFEAPTLADLAARVEAAQQDDVARSAPPLIPVPRQGALPLSFAQERLWFLDRLQPESSAYNMVEALRADGSLELPALEASLREVVRRHEVLRTRFADRNGEPVQEIVPAGDWGLALVDLSGLAEPSREAEVRQQVEREAARPFDLSQGRLLRCTVLRLGSREHVLVVNIHHIAADGWSVRLLVEEVEALYVAARSDRPSPLPELPIQYVDFATWQRDWLQGGMLERQLGYWRQRLEGLPPLELPTDRPRPALPSLRGGSVPWAIGPALTEPLQSLSRREGATLFMSLVAGFSALLSRYAGQQDLAVGTPIAGRRLLETEGLIGCFVNNLVLRQDLTGNPEWTEWLSRVRRGTLEAYAHQDLPFERLVEELRPERRLSHNPLFQVVLTLQNAPRERLELGELKLEPWAIAS
ncbi:MAG TPA: condensation domain-containing protein, partial [Thermoanaerobaculia bacterium]|nr:condensation domain-containing protein [Thermoanaerobaculia bacterium]